MLWTHGDGKYESSFLTVCLLFARVLSTSCSFLSRIPFLLLSLYFLCSILTPYPDSSAFSCLFASFFFYSETYEFSRISLSVHVCNVCGKESGQKRGKTCGQERHLLAAKALI